MSTLFNQAGTTFNSEVFHTPTGNSATRFVQRVPDALSALPAGPRRPRLRVVPFEDTEAPQPVVEPVSIRYLPARGSYSATRAIDTVQQHRVQFWDRGGAIDAAVTSAPSPTPDAVDAAYAAIQSSGLPQVMIPSRAAYAAMSDPSQHAAFLQANRQNLSIDTSYQSVEVSDVNVSLLPAVPYTPQLGIFCSDISFSSSIIVRRS